MSSPGFMGSPHPLQVIGALVHRTVRLSSQKRSAKSKSASIFILVVTGGLIPSPSISGRPDTSRSRSPPGSLDRLHGPESFCADNCNISHLGQPWAYRRYGTFPCHGTSPGSQAVLLLQSLRQL